MDIEKLVQESLGSVLTKASQNRRKKFLIDYYNNPHYCKQCGELIKVKPEEKVKDVKKKTFCGIACANLYAKENANKYPNRQKSIISQLTDYQIEEEEVKKI